MIRRKTFILFINLISLDQHQLHQDYNAKNDKNSNKFITVAMIIPWRKFKRHFLNRPVEMAPEGQSMLLSRFSSVHPDHPPDLWQIFAGKVAAAVVAEEQEARETETVSGFGTAEFRVFFVQIARLHQSATNPLLAPKVDVGVRIPTRSSLSRPILFALLGAA